MPMRCGVGLATSGRNYDIFHGFAMIPEKRLCFRYCVAAGAWSAGQLFGGVLPGAAATAPFGLALP
jgi:hypothetical protein